MSDARVFVGNLPMDVREREVEDLFYKYGKIRSIDLKVGLTAERTEILRAHESGLLDMRVEGHCYKLPSLD